MLPRAHRVVVTGLACYTPLGANINSSWNALLQGKCGLRKIEDLTNYDALYKPISRLIPPEVKVGSVSFDATSHPILTDQARRRMSLFCQIAAVTVEDALSHANLLSEPGIIADGINLDRAGCIIGSGLPSISDVYDAAAGLLSDRRPTISPFFIPKALNNMATGNVSIKYNLRGVTQCPSTACATGNNAIGDAYNYIKLGYADVIVAGASEMNVHPMSLAGFLKAKSITTSGISRPFDIKRDGFVLGEGCGILILESLDHALKRGAHIVAEIVGYGLSSDAYHITSPLEDGDGARRSMEMAIRQAMPWEDRYEVGYVNAHATSTVLGDRAEARAIKAIFGDFNGSTFVSSNKGNIGHLLGAAGAVESIFTIKALQDGIIPHTLNLKTVGEASGDCKKYFSGIQFVQDRPRKAELKFALNNSFGFGGINSSLLYKNFDG